MKAFLIDLGFAIAWVLKYLIYTTAVALVIAIVSAVIYFTFVDTTPAHIPHEKCNNASHH